MLALTAGGATIHPPLQIFAGDTWEFEFDCEDANGDPLDLTNAQISWFLDNTDQARTNVLQKTLADDVTIYGDPVNGVCLVRPRQISTTNFLGTNALEPGFYWDRLVVTTQDGLVTTQVAGRIQVLQPL